MAVRPTRAASGRTCGPRPVGPPAPRPGGGGWADLGRDLTCPGEGRAAQKLRDHGCGNGMRPPAGEPPGKGGSWLLGGLSRGLGDPRPLASPTQGVCVFRAWAARRLQEVCEALPRHSRQVLGATASDGFLCVRPQPVGVSQAWPRGCGLVSVNQVSLKRGLTSQAHAYGCVCARVGRRVGAEASWSTEPATLAARPTQETWWAGCLTPPEH